MKPTLVIYEDKELRRENFGPHRLMMALAFDVEQTNGTRREVFEASFRAFPRGGADKVVDMICGEPPTEAADTARGASVIALLDSDHLVDMLLRRFKGSYADLESARADLERRARSQTPGVFIGRWTPTSSGSASSSSASTRPSSRPRLPDKPGPRTAPLATSC